MKSPKTQSFFFNINLVILAIVVLGFGLNTLLRPNHQPPSYTGLAFHGFFMMAWYLIIVVQPALIRIGKTSAHKRLGRWSIIVVLGVLLSSPVVTIQSFQRVEDPMIVIANIVNLVNFSLLYSWAIWKRFSPDTHKRAIVFASLALLPPATFRLFVALNLNPFASLLLWFALMIAIIIYDIRTLKRVHAMTIAGTALMIVGTMVILSIGPSAQWLLYLQSTVGN